ncbi:MAG: flagellar hook assembly protein FlgD [Caulobacterales bacterium]
MAVDTINTTNTAQSGNALSRASLAENFDTFLTLLTAQLQNQDPLSPMDSNQFTQQLVQFSQVEQQIATNERLESMIDQSKAAAAGSALSYLGNDAVIASDKSLLSDDAAVWSYSLPETASTVTVEIRDATGRTVLTKTGDLGAGSHLVSWDGRNSQGVAQPDGLYQLVITAKDSAGEKISADISTRETIIGVDFASSSPKVLTNSGTHEFSTVRAILNN